MTRLFAFAMVLLATSPALAAEISYTRQATPAEVAAIRKAVPDLIKQAESMPPWTAWAADGPDGKVAVRIEGQAVCGSMVGCPAFVIVKGKVTWRGMQGETADWPQP
jgi:hypothetical protein